MHLHLLLRFRISRIGRVIRFIVTENGLEFKEEFLEFLLRKDIFAIFLIADDGKADQNILRNNLKLPLDLEGIEQLPKFALFLLNNLTLD